MYTSSSDQRSLFNNLDQIYYGFSNLIEARLAFTSHCLNHWTDTGTEQNNTAESQPLSIHSRYSAHIPPCSMHLLSVRLVDTPTVVPAPPSAASRIEHKPFASLLQSKWNEQVGSVFDWVRTSDRRLEDWGHKLLYGEDQTKP